MAKPRKSLWPPVHELTYTNGTKVYQVRYQIGGKRQSQVFPTRPLAEAHASQIRLKLQNEGAAAFNLPAAARIEAVRALEKLAPHKATIAEAVDFYLEHFLKYRNAPTVSKIVELLVAEAKSNNRRDRTITDLRIRLKHFVQSFGDRQLASITLQELATWLNDPTLSARSRINNSVKISQLYNYAIRNQWVEHNIATSISRPDSEDSEPGILSVEQCSRLLAHAPGFDLLAYVAIGLFAGLRVAEIQRLDWCCIKLAERTIVVGAEVAKKRSRRIVDINDTLAAWLPLCAKAKGPVVPLESSRTLYARLARLAKATGLQSWPDNALRHSCASYSLALTGNAVQVASQLGNSADMIHRHYKALVTKADAERFWALRPDAKPSP